MRSVWRHIRPHLSRLVRFLHISYLEARSDYQGTLLGVAWIPFSTLLFSIILGVVFHSAGEQPAQLFFLYVLSGYTCWNFISESIRGSVEVIQTRLDFAVHRGLTLFGLFAKLLIDRLFELGLNIALLSVAVLILSPSSLGVHTLLLAPLLLVLSFTSLAVSYLVNLATILAPDFINLIKSGVRMVFFATPVFWTTGGEGIRFVLEHFNPASYFLNVTRQVYGIQPLAWEPWAIACAIGLGLCLMGALAYRRSNKFVRNVK